jgi:hypothetical protein
MHAANASILNFVDLIQRKPTPVVPANEVVRVTWAKHPKGGFAHVTIEALTRELAQGEIDSVVRGADADGAVVIVNGPTPIDNQWRAECSVESLAHSQAAE